MVKPGTFDPVEHRRQKQAAREKDAADLASGRVSPEELTRRNSLFPEGVALRIKHDPYLERYKGKRRDGKARNLSNR
jgi:hypothetical protein